MKKESMNRLFDQWVESKVLFDAGPDEFGTETFHQAIGKMIAFSQMFLEVAGDQSTYQSRYWAECEVQARARAEEIIASYRARLVAATEKTAAYAAHA